MANPNTLEVTFIRAEGEMMIRMTVDRDQDAILKAAKTLKAHHVVFQAYQPTPQPIWAVFDLSRLVDGRLGLADKTFVAEKNDAAVMWAMHQRSG